MLKKINFNIYIGIYLILFVLSFITALMYDAVKMETADFGTIGNSLILALANIFQFPFNTIVKPTSDIIFFIGLLFNIAIYAVLIYFILMELFKRVRDLIP